MADWVRQLHHVAGMFDTVPSDANAGEFKMTRHVDPLVSNSPATFSMSICLAALCVTTVSLGCGEDPSSPVGEARQAQEELEEAREEAAELLSEAEEEAVDIIADAKEKADDEISDAKSEADQLIGDAQRNLDAKIDRLQTFPTPAPDEPASSPSSDDQITPPSGT
ncbi:ATP synthase subunit B family protein [Roseiconus lacunae]|uniref:hypothetical protein n=1 Tax=Roseiconus lacunae TaxID=2605694 RepID=UPI0011F11F9E|nr:hypothetical protein [Roseiconus lacunae]